MDEFGNRFSAAKQIRQAQIEGPAREVYKFCFNGRETEWDATQPKTYDPEEIFTDVPATLAEDFYGELFSTMTPENASWVEFEAGAAIEEDDEQQAKEDLALYEKTMDKALSRSNYYDEGQTAFQDAVIGNVAMWVERPTLNGNTVCEAIPMPETYLTIGPHGIADRFRKKSYYTRDLKALFPKAKWPQKLQDKIKNAKNGRSDVVWGFWPTYEDPENPIWRAEIRVEGDAIGLDKDLKAKGEMPMVVGRFNPKPGSPWGRGPGLRMLPTIRVLNALTEMTLEGMDRNLDPAYTYPHDGMLDLSDGIESGMTYPSAPGSAESIKAIGTVEHLDQNFHSQDKLEEVLNNGFYRELEQRGKTPPSASQYIGQEQKQLRRIARPAGKLWREFGVGLLERLEFLERQRGGLLDGVKLPMIENGVVAPRPISPLERAQAREDVMVSQSIIDMTVQSVGPEQSMVLIDMPTSMKNIKDKLKDKLVTFRTQEEVMQAMMQMQQQQQGAPSDGDPQ
jgi:hypothetical protein